MVQNGKIAETGGENGARGARVQPNASDGECRPPNAYLCEPFRVAGGCGVVIWRLFPAVEA